MSDDSPPSKRARMVVFEPIRLPSAHNASALSHNILAAQHYKLSERFRIKQRQIAVLEKRIEELENRHSSDDELICIINRQWNQLDDIMVDLLKRFVDEGHMNETVDSNRSETNWLTILSQLNNDEIAQRLESRVNFSKEALTHLLKAMNSYSQKRDRILSVLETSSKGHSEKSPDAGAEDSRDAMEITQDREADNEAKEPVDIDAALRQELDDLIAENKRLEAMVAKLQKDKTKLATKFASHNDEIELMEAKVENAVNQLEDLRFELEKSIAREEKLESQIIKLKENEQKAPAPGETSQQQKNVKPVVKQEKGETSDSSQQQLGDLQHEIEIQTETAEKRLAEIQTLSSQNQELMQKVFDLENMIKFLPTSVISSSPDYMCLRLKYTHLVEESKRLETANQELLKYNEDLRKTYEDSLKQVKQEFNTAMSRMQDNCAQISEELMDARKKHALVELEFKQKYEADCIEARSYKDVKSLITAARNEAQRRAEEVERMKKHIAALKAELKKAKDELEEARKVPDAPADNPAPVPPPQRPDRSGAIEKARKQIQLLTTENERLKLELNDAKQTEKGLTRELESITHAVEDLLNKNQKLNEQIAEKDEIHIRQVKEGLQSEATLRVLKQNIDSLEEKLRYVNNELQATKVECTTWEAQNELLKTMQAQLEATLKKTNTALETFRRQSLNVNADLNELKIRHEKQTAEIQDLRQQMKERVANTEGSRAKIARLREERNQLRKKLARAKQASEYENIDELLQHENRVLRESLACPSCKTNDKNTVLTKCFHVFCMECIKKRYDARSRKCPKCNAGFGANDYHRIYFE